MLKTYTKNPEIVYLEGKDLPNIKNIGKFLSIDTERMGLQLHRDRICLIQIYDVYKHKLYFLKIPVNIDFSTYRNLKEIMESRKFVKLFHYAISDIKPLTLMLNTKINNISCTKLMAKIALTYTQHHGLKTLMNVYFNVSGDYLGNTYWGGTVDAKQFIYAAKDVMYLHKIYIKMLKQLYAERRVEIFNYSVIALENLAYVEAMGFSYEYLLGFDSKKQFD